jgi:hypothetical protein
MGRPEGPAGASAVVLLDALTSAEISLPSGADGGDEFSTLAESLCV